ncbi:DUF4240 domain-containing protein [Nonomuraea sp. NN258]|uniref:DUF4240 domain-containing protein n=1 Tax=Nonomuraea antri TaxID=2730852 RepID=UPI001567D0D5|nr:DUF4240 domain-containing protein [Nonomuraea antri]NRQ40890.1 DUF4240 domain-containing protein [Nonomuraea antri]
MEMTGFWDLVEASALASDDPAERANWLVGQLAARSADEVVDFHLHRLTLSERASTLRAEADRVLGRCSDDRFQRFVQWAIGQGETWFTHLITSPGPALAGFPGSGRRASALGWEQLLYVAPRAYRQVTGRANSLLDPTPSMTGAALTAERAVTPQPSLRRPHRPDHTTSPPAPATVPEGFGLPPKRQ